MRCYRCGRAIPPDSIFCQFCGEDLSRMHFCPFCGFQLQEGVNFCPQCGKDLRIAASAQPEDARELSPPQSQEETAASAQGEPAAASESGTAETSETEQDAESRGGYRVWNAQEAVSEAGEAIPAENEWKPERPLPVSGSGAEGASAADSGFRRRKKPGWILPVVLCAAMAVILLWSRVRSAAKADPSEIADSVLYLEIYNENDEIIGTASGFLVKNRTTLVTNYHVAQEARHITATTADLSDTVDVSQLLTYDEVADLAVLRCDTEVDASPLVLGDSETVRQGDAIYAVGYPLGIANTLSDGIVSSRYLDGYDNDTIQITAAISEGNSGGPLLNTNGRVIGVICACYVHGQNLNVAVSSNTLESLLASDFHRINLADWENRPEAPRYESNEETQEPGVGETEAPAGE